MFRKGCRDIGLQFLSLESIDGRSKVDRLAKFFAILQATWFCIQFIVRMHQSLPVSLLELNTFAHSLCALIIYVLWWHKPGGIDDPFVIYTHESQALKDLCATQWALGASGKHYEMLSPHEDESTGVKNIEWTPAYTHAGSETNEFLSWSKRNNALSRQRRGLVYLPRK